MGIRTRSALALVTVVVGLLMTAVPAGSEPAHVFPSTNDDNRAAGHPHVNQVGTGPGTVTSSS